MILTQDFKRRSEALELMDADDAPIEELRRTLGELGFINRVLGGHAATLSAINELAPHGLKRLRVLDVGCGDGEAAACIQRWGGARGFEVSVHGIDISEASVRLAQERRREGLSFAKCDLFDLPAAQDYDIVHAGLLLHHCPGELAARALKSMHDRARLGVAVNDLHRHPLAYHAIQGLTSVFSRDRFIRHDAPLSVLRGFRRSELEELCRQAGLPDPEIHWRWAFRWSMVIRR